MPSLFSFFFEALKLSLEREREKECFLVGNEKC